MPNELNLLPCPFCGSESVKVTGRYRKKWHHQGVGYNTYSVKCNKCHARGGTASGYTRNALYELTERGEAVLETEHQIIQRAVAAWNRRANDEQQIDEKSCKDCVHYEVCRFVNALAVANVVNAENCRMFKDTKGYRKASDVAKDIFAEIEKYLVTGTTFYGEAIHSIGIGTFANLKKKYESEGTDDE